MAMLVITPGFLPLLTCTTVRKQKIEVLRGSLEVSETWRTSWGESYGRWDWSFYWGKYGKMILYSPIFGHVKIWENMASFRDWSYGHSNCGPHFQSQLISNGVPAQRPWTPKWSRLETPLAVSVVSSSAADAKWMRCPGSTDIFLSNQCDGVSALASSTMWG